MIRWARAARRQQTRRLHCWPARPSTRRSWKQDSDQRAGSDAARLHLPTDDISRSRLHALEGPHVTPRLPPRALVLPLRREDGRG